MTEEEKKYWLGFSAFPGIGPLRFKLLLDYFTTAKDAWEASEKDLIKIGLGGKLTAKFADFRRNFSVDKNYQEIIAKKIWILTLSDREYPRLLKEISDAPYVLYLRGNLEEGWDIAKSIGVVGTRMITSYGKEATRRITEGLVDAGLTIVSGMAYGVDTMAHETAISTGGKTIAVLGCGVDIIHPASNTTLYWKIVKKYGLVISEYPPGRYAEKGLFPARNRIISGLSLGVVVTEGAKDSGALITARNAAEQGREVFAVPGPITSEMSKAGNMLLKNGAKLVTGAEDVLEELKIPNYKLQITCLAGRQANKIKNSKLHKSLNKEEITILQLLQNENLHFDEIVIKSKIPSGKLGGILTVMEIKKMISLYGSGIYGLTS